MPTLIVSIVVFTAVILLLVSIISVAKYYFVSSESVEIVINNNTNSPIIANIGMTLLEALSNNNIFVSSACGGQGICGTCKVKVNAGGGVITPVELNHMSEVETHHNVRLACQVRLKHDLTIELSGTILSARQWQCEVRSNHNVSTFIKELVLALPVGESVPFRAGGYIVVECPVHQLHYKDFDIDPRYHDRWDELNMWRYHSMVNEATQRSYSMANYPLEKDVLILNVRIASPPPDQPQVPPGIVSSYLFSLRMGDTVQVIGPYGQFYARESEAEMIFIGGGAGMAPMRSHILDQLKRLQTSRKIQFWYGARSLCEAFYVEEFNQLARKHDNFDWTLALSVDLPEDNWYGAKGFIHQVVYDEYLSEHPSPEDAEYYLCGPPAMIDACIQMLQELGVSEESILFDKFG